MPAHSHTQVHCSVMASYGRRVRRMHLQTMQHKLEAEWTNTCFEFSIRMAINEGADLRVVLCRVNGGFMGQRDNFNNSKYQTIIAQVLIRFDVNSIQVRKWDLICSLLARNCSSCIYDCRARRQKRTQRVCVCVSGDEWWAAIVSIFGDSM